MKNEEHTEEDGRKAINSNPLSRHKIFMQETSNKNLQNCIRREDKMDKTYHRIYQGEKPTGMKKK